MSKGSTSSRGRVAPRSRGDTLVAEKLNKGGGVSSMSYYTAELHYAMMGPRLMGRSILEVASPSKVMEGKRKVRMVCKPTISIVGSGLRSCLRGTPGIRCLPRRGRGDTRRAGGYTRAGSRTGGSRGGAITTKAMGGRLYSPFAKMMTPVRRTYSRTFTKGVVKSNCLIHPRRKVTCTPRSTAMSFVFPSGRTINLADSSKARCLLRVNISAMGLSKGKFRAFMGSKSQMGGNSGLVNFSVGCVRRRTGSSRYVIMFADLRRNRRVEVSGDKGMRGLRGATRVMDLGWSVLREGENSKKVCQIVGILGGGKVLMCRIRAKGRVVLLKGNIKFKGGPARRVRGLPKTGMCSLIAEEGRRSILGAIGKVHPRFVRTAKGVVRRTRGIFRGVGRRVLLPVTSRVTLTTGETGRGHRLPGPFAPSVHILFKRRCRITLGKQRVVRRLAKCRVSRSRIKFVALRVRTNLSSRTMSRALSTAEVMGRKVTVVRRRFSRGLRDKSLKYAHLVDRVCCVVLEAHGNRKAGTSFGSFVFRGCPEAKRTTGEIYSCVSERLGRPITGRRVKFLTVRVRQIVSPSAM